MINFDTVMIGKGYPGEGRDNYKWNIGFLRI